MRFSSVLLPQPDGPTIDAKSPGSSSSETSSSATMRPPSNDFVTRSTTTSTPPFEPVGHFGFTSRFRTFVYVLPPIFAFTVQRSVSPPNWDASRESGGKIM